ncbi:MULTISPECIES: N-formylglutamate amidohydrolase [unclassified Mesorhizobium]|uniref:N-formylglutamate amidohydrolase n=1 Tax=unclassified Mesorhizobium TaxID=325217 RepID=UPI000FCA0242|nr:MULTISPECIES: N-formylglutamate amidohydrolase [unclassified Mesorhizobium]RUV27055.1 N-formylglutamate amidohydrolase [Mesorhizobium sp. M1A.F.Ca.IN.022.04.1.1]RWG35564.1 MAG: N-formylglutamate amidohydrolase [Mesorhizobium sp.]
MVVTAVSSVGGLVETFTNVLSPSDPIPVETVNIGGHSGFVLVCEHAGTAIPQRLDGLGLPAAEMQRHIAYDIGAEGVARQLAEVLDAPLFLQRYSRLVVDCNRPFDAPDCIPEVSDETLIPGNLRLAAQERRLRYVEIHQPFHFEVGKFLDRRAADGVPTTLVAVHSFTPRLMNGPERPWKIGVLSNRGRRFAEHFLSVFQARNPTITSAHNQPYVVDDKSDYTIPVHGEARGLPHLLLEIRNDLIGEIEGQRAWASLIAEALVAANTPAKEI